MKIKTLKEDKMTGFSEYATLHNRHDKQSLSKNKTYTFTHKGIGENITILYTGNIEITNITVDGNTLLDSAVQITANPAILFISWDSSISITFQATSDANIFILYTGT
jgi:hypothetical protein